MTKVGIHGEVLRLKIQADSQGVSTKPWAQDTENGGKQELLIQKAAVLEWVKISLGLGESFCCLHGNEENSNRKWKIFHSLLLHFQLLGFCFPESCSIISAVFQRALIIGDIEGII